MPLNVDSSFGAQERASLQPLASALSSVLAQPVPSTAKEDIAPRLALGAQEKAQLLERITAMQLTAAALVQAHVSSSARAEEAGQKAAAWGIAGAGITAILLVIVAIVTTVFSVGSSAGANMAAIVAAIEAQVSFLGTAATAGHPLAGELAAILKLQAEALRDFLRNRDQDNRTAITQMLTAMELAQTRLARLPERASQVKGRCQGDPHAIFEACQSLRESLGGFSAILQRVPREDTDTQPVVASVATLRGTLAEAVRALAPKTLPFRS